MEKYKKKLIVFLSRFPFPLEKGDKLRAYYQLEDLSKEFDIYLFCTVEKEIKQKNLDKISPFCKEINLFRLKKSLILFNLIKAGFSKTSFQVAYFSQNWIKKSVDKKLAKIDPDHIYCQLVRTSEYVKNYHRCPKTIDLMDALSKGMERRAKKSKFWMKYIFNEESIRLKMYETKILDYFENFTIISEQDKKFIIHPKNKDIKVIANGVSEVFLNTKLNKNKLYDLVFTGNMSYAPNVETGHFLVEKLADELNQAGFKLKLGIVGINPSPSLLKLRSSQVTVTGWVEDIIYHYASSRIFIAPMLSGTGLQNKILEAMAVGLPCITTNLANNAILAEHDKEIIIADTIDQMVFFISKLLNDKEFYQKISENGQRFVKENYNWNSINKKLIKILS